jgi:hypothetical protein
MTGDDFNSGPLRLLTYASGRYEPRRKLLVASACAAGATDEARSYTPKDLGQLGFMRRCPAILLSERGGGWWSWKPFLILHELKQMRDGEWLLYCDVGRTYPLKLIDRQLSNLVLWAEERRQPCMPGLSIPWTGPMSRWTKRDAFVLTGLDQPEYHAAAPIQASFSLWKKCPESEAFVSQWLEWCADRRMVTDDPNTCGVDNLPDFQDHRHDQSLLTLLCHREGIQALELGETHPGFDEKNPSQVAKALGEFRSSMGFKIHAIRCLAPLLGQLETLPRRFLPK